MPVVLILFIAILAGPVWAGEIQPDQLSGRWASWFSGQDLQASPKSAARPAYQATLTPTFYTRPSALASVRDLSRDLERPRTEGLLATTTWLNGAFSTETEVATNQHGDDGLQKSLPATTANDPSTGMMRLGLTGSSGSLRYGIKYRNAGQHFYTSGADEAVQEMWGEWKQGLATVSSAFGQQWDNVAADPTRARLQQNYGRIGLSWNQPAWPALALTYSQKALNNTLIPTGLAPQKANDQTLEAALGYTGQMWNARLASSYGFVGDLLRNGSESRVKNQTVTAAFRPFTTLTIAPTLGYRAEQQEWSGVRVEAPSASLALNYRQSQRLLISAMGNYSLMRSSDRLVALETVGGKGILAWDLQKTQDWSTLLSFEAGFNRQNNYVTPSAQTEDLSGILRLVVAPL